MAKSKILGQQGTENYYMSDCPFTLPKENVKFFHMMQGEASKDPFPNYNSYGNAVKPDWMKPAK